MDSNLQEEFNKQISLEFNSAYLYFAMSTYFDEIYMSGFSSFMKETAKEKLKNANPLNTQLKIKCLTERKKKKGCLEYVQNKEIKLDEELLGNEKELFLYDSSLKEKKKEENEKEKTWKK